MPEKNDPSPEIPLYVGETQIGSAEIPMGVWGLIGVVVGAIAIVIAIIAFTRR